MIAAETGHPRSWMALGI